MNPMPMKNFVTALSIVTGLPRRFVPQPLSIASFPVKTSETSPRSVPQLRQNFPASGLSIPHFGQNMFLNGKWTIENGKSVWHFLFSIFYFLFSIFHCYAVFALQI